MNDRSHTIIFTIVICLVCSTLLALASSGLRERKERNRALYVKKNILKVVNLYNRDMGLSDEEVEDLYEKSIQGMVIDKKGEEIKDVLPGDTKTLKKKDLHPLYLHVENGKSLVYVLYVEGKGLWSTVKGYLALDADAETVTGIAFFDHGETPGLGGEIEKDWFTTQWKGKRIFDPEGKLTPTQIVKGKVAGSKYAKEAEYYVDGISGATLTGNGINKFIAKDLKVYEPFLRKIRKKG